MLPDGTKHRLLSLGRFDWRWQIRYPLSKPLEVAAGTRIECDGVFDNSAANPFNPDATQTVRGGPGVNDETLMLIVEMIVNE